MKDPARFILDNTLLEAPALIPEIKLYLAHELLPIWRASEVDLQREGVNPPFWAFAWAGGQALARYLLDYPDVVRGKRLLDFGAGSGLQGIAALKCGASEVLFNDIDPHALTAIQLNAKANGFTAVTLAEDLIGQDDGWDVVLAGDVCYEKPMAERIDRWLKDLSSRGALVLIGDPGRTYLPRLGLSRITGYAVKTTREIEDTDLRNAVVWRVDPR